MARVFLTVLLLILLIAPAEFAQARVKRGAAQAAAFTLTGRWRVKFTLPGGVVKNLIFESKPRGTGWFRLLDTGPEDKPVANPQAAVWSALTDNRVSFSGEAELPYGTCCREIGTVTFKGRFDSADLITGKMVFVTSVDEEENPFKLRAEAGTFTATRMSR